MDIDHKVKFSARTVSGMCGVAASVLVLTACSSAGSDSARAVANRFEQAGGSCELLSPKAMDDLTEHGSQPCAQALAAVRIPRQQVEQIEVWGAEAQARTASDVLFLHQYADGWRITGADCRAAGEDLPYTCEVGGS